MNDARPVCDQVLDLLIEGDRLLRCYPAGPSSRSIVTRIFRRHTHPARDRQIDAWEADVRATLFRHPAALAEIRKASLERRAGAFGLGSADLYPRHNRLRRWVSVLQQFHATQC